LADAPSPNTRGTKVKWAGQFVPELSLRGFRYAVEDPFARDFAPGAVLKAEIVLRFVQLRLFKDGTTRWETEVLELGRPHP
jgi:hypothetical protein